MDDKIKKQILEEERQRLQEIIELHTQLIGMLASVKNSIGDVTISEALQRTEEVLNYICQQAENENETMESEFSMRAFELHQKEIIDSCMEELEKRLDEE